MGTFGLHLVHRELMDWGQQLKKVNHSFRQRPVQLSFEWMSDGLKKIRSKRGLPKSQILSVIL